MKAVVDAVVVPTEVPSLRIEYVIGGTPPVEPVQLMVAVVCVEVAPVMTGAVKTVEACEVSVASPISTTTDDAPNTDEIIFFILFGVVFDFVWFMFAGRTDHHPGFLLPKKRRIYFVARLNRRAFRNGTLFCCYCRRTVNTPPHWTNLSVRTIRKTVEEKWKTDRYPPLL